MSILFVFIAYLSHHGCGSSQQAKNKQILLEKRKAAWDVLKQNLENEIPQFKGEASIVIKELDTGWRFVLNKEKKVPSASLVKLPIMTACFNAIAEGKLDSEKPVVLRANHKVSGSGKLKHASEGTKLTIEELIELMIVESDNTATNILIEMAGYDYLNTYFKKIGLKSTNISRKMMDIKKRSQGIENYTTAGDIALILEKIYTGSLINKDISSRCLELLKRQKYRDRIAGKLPADTVVAHKTGLENGVCHDAGVVFTDRGNFLICVLTRHQNKTAHLSKKFISEIAFLTYNYYQDL